MKPTGSRSGSGRTGPGSAQTCSLAGTTHPVPGPAQQPQEVRRQVRRPCASGLLTKVHFLNAERHTEEKPVMEDFRKNSRWMAVGRREAGGRGSPAWVPSAPSPPLFITRNCRDSVRVPSDDLFIARADSHSQKGCRPPPEHPDAPPLSILPPPPQHLPTETSPGHSPRGSQLPVGLGNHKSDLCVGLCRKPPIASRDVRIRPDSSVGRKGAAH